MNLDRQDLFDIAKVFRPVCLVVAVLWWSTGSPASDGELAGTASLVIIMSAALIGARRRRHEATQAGHCHPGPGQQELPVYDGAQRDDRGLTGTGVGCPVSLGVTAEASR